MNDSAHRTPHWILLDRIGLGAWDHDLATGVTRWSDGAYRLLGHAPQSFALTEASWVALVHPDDRAAAQDGLARLLAQGAPVTAEYRLRKTDDDWLWVRDQAAVQTRDAAGTPLTIGGVMTDITTEKRLERQARRQLGRLEESGTLLRNVLDASGEGILLIDSEGRVLQHNRRFQELWGVADEIIADGQGDRLLAHLLGQLVDPAAFLADVRRLHDSDGESDDTLECSDGRVIARLSRPVTLGGRRARLWSFRDATARVNAETDLREVMRAANEAIWICDESGRLRFANAAACAATGHALDELLQLRLSQLLDAGEQDGFADHLAELRHRRVIHKDWCLRRKDGSPLAMELATQHIGHRQLLAIGHEIGDLRQRERQAMDERARLRTLVQSLPDLIWLKDPEGVYLACNGAFERFFGARETDIVGKTDYDFVPRDLADFFRAHDRAAMAAGAPTVNEEWLTFADGGYHGLFQTTKTPMRDDHDALIGVLGIAHDITESRRTAHGMQERIKELRCLYDVSAITESDSRPVDDILQAVVERLPAAWQHPALAEACIAIGERRYATPGHAPSVREQFAPLRDGQRQIGLVSVIYRQPPPAEYGEVFLAEEQELLDSVAARVSGFLARREAAAALRAREDIFRAIAEQAVDAIALIEFASGRFVEFNEAAHRGLGYSREEFAALTVTDIQAVDSAFVAEKFELVGRQGSAVFESRHRHKDGSFRDTRVAARLVDRDGTRYMAAIWSDITREHETAQRLRESEALYRSVVGAMSEGIIVTDGAGLILAVNPATERLLGLSRRDLIGRSAIDSDWDVVDENRQPWPEAEQPAATALRTGQPQHEKILGLRIGDASLRWMSVNAEPLTTGAEGGQRGVVITFADVTARKKAEDRLRASEQALTDAQAVAQIGSWSLAIASGHLAWSAQTYRIFGVPQDQPMTLEAFFASIHPDDIDLTGSTWEKALADGDYDIEHRIVVAGETRWVRERAEIRRTSAGAPYFAIGTAQDITERKRIELELERHRDHLRELVAERTAELEATNRELEAARDVAEAANRAKGSFLANMSHEIRTPMNAIIGLTHLIARGTLEPKQREQIDKVGAAAHHLLGIINDVLDFSKIESGKFGIERADFAFDGVINRVMSLVAERAEAKGLVLATEIDDAIPARLNGDALRLGQILLNFMSNAVKFTPRGTVTLRASVVEREADHLVLRIEVRDSGIGISPDLMPRLFQSFEQADTSTTRRFGGTGLGLAISRGLAHLMDGEVGAESAPEVGSTFWLRLPLGLATGAPVVAEEAAAVSAPRRGTRILVAEDNPVNQEVTLEMLRDLGCVPDLAENGKQAVAMVQSTAYDLVLMDVQMPEMDGLEATREIRRLLPGRRLPILAMTANAFAEDRQECLRAGMDDHVPKPVSPEQLLAALTRWLPSSPMSSLPADAPAPPAPTAADGPLREALGQIHGLDAAAGLRRFGGRAEKYAALLRSYAESHGGDAAILRQHLAAGRRQEARGLAHSLKGASAMLGASAVQALAAALEQALAEGGDPAAIEHATGVLEQARAALAADIRNLLPAPASASGEIDWTRLAADTRSLVDLLADDDIRASDLFREIRPQLSLALDAGALADIEARIAGFAYDEALLLLRRAMAAEPRFQPAA